MRFQIHFENTSVYDHAEPYNKYPDQPYVGFLWCSYYKMIHNIGEL